MSTKLLFTSIYLLLISVVESNPGLQARISQVGLDYANAVAIGIFTKDLKGKKIPDISGKNDDLSYTISDIYITDFTQPTSSMNLAPPGGVVWHASNIGLTIRGRFHYDYKKWLIHLSDSGNVKVKVSGTSFNIKLLIDAKDGKPTIKHDRCSSDIDDVQVSFSGGGIVSWIYNLLSGFVGNALKKSLDSQICVLLNDMVDKSAEEALEKLKVMVDIGTQFELDYRLIKPPVFTYKYLETYHKGEVYWKSNPKEAPFVAPVLPTDASSRKMFYLWMSDYLVNTLLYQAERHNFLTYNMTSQDLPAGNRSILNTTCNPGPCIGSLITALGKKYPGCQVELDMLSKTVPQFRIGSGEVHLKAGGDVNVLAACPKSKAPIALFTLGVNSTASIALKLEKEKIHGKLTNMSLTMDVTKTTIKEITKKSLGLLTIVIKGFVMEKLNGLGSAGFPIPVTDNIQLVNPSLKLFNDTLYIATDVHYII